MAKDEYNSPQQSDELISYWQQQLAGSLPLLELPADKPRQPLSAGETETQPIVLAESLVTSLDRISQAHNVEIFTTLLAAFKVLIYRYADQQDILIGSPITSLNTDRLAGLNRYCDNVVFRADLSGNPTFSQVLQRIKQVVANARAHQDLSFDQLITALNIDRSSSYHPLFQVMFSLEQNTADLAIVTIPSFPASIDLALKLEQSQSHISGYFEYSADLFASETIQRMAKHFQVLLESIAIDPEQSINQLPLLTDADRQQLLVDWNQTQAEYPNRSIHQLFEAQVELTPDNIAVVFEQHQLTYRELNNQANQLAHYLRAQGVGKDVLVGLYLERSLAMVVGLWGILKAGGAYVPLDPAYPKDRVAYILADAQAQVLIADPHLLASLPAHQAAIICLDRDRPEIAQQPQSNPVNDSDPANLAYVIYTSGSTGNPKGVAVCHQSQANLLAYLQHTPGLTSSDILLAVTTICFDTSTADMYLPLLVGAKIVLVSSEVAADGFQLLAKLTESGATFLQATPVTFRLLLAAGWQGSPQLRVVSTGEALARSLADLLIDKVAELWDLYGPTETTVWSTGSKINDLRQVSNYQGALELIGKPIANTQTYILDRYLQPVPLGIHGELHIGGDCLAKGYLNRPELTAAKFIPNPFSDAPNARLYKTGDLARYLPDGNIEYIGRIDNQIKIRGFRIELSEIEGLLAKHPDVKEVATIVREDTPDNRRLVAYIVAKTSQIPTVKSLREFLAVKLPSYMIPVAFVFLDVLPLTPNGKIDRRALPIPSSNHQLDNTFVASQDDLELQLTQLWEQALGIQPIGIADNFFELGGHSLIAVKLLGEIDLIWHQKLPLATFIAAPTIQQFATILRQEQGSTTWSSLVVIESRGSKTPLFCIHPVGGNVLEYYPLAHHLGLAQPIYGIQSPGLDGIQAPLTQIEAMAANYITEIQTVQPDGPYLLVGYSFGGLIAFEIARQLESRGEKVNLLALLDTESPSLLNVRPSLFKTSGIHLRNFKQLNLQDKIKYVRDRVVFRLMYQNRENGRKEFMLDNWGVDLPPAYLKVLEANFQAGEDYIGKFYPGKITLFRSSIQPITQALHPDLGWGSLADMVEIYDVQGHHSNLLKEPYIYALAQKLKLCIDSASGRYCQGKRAATANEQ
jgi:surfactin family lipopeptide synthetase A